MLLAYFMIYDLTYRSYFIPFIAFFGPNFSTPILSWPVRYHLLHLSYCGDLLVELLASWGGRMILYIYNYAWNCADFKRMLRCCFHFVSMSLYQNRFFFKKTMNFKPPFLWVPCFHICKNLTSMQQSQLGWDCPTCGTVRQTVPCWLVVWNIFPYIVNNDPNWRTHIFHRYTLYRAGWWFGTCFHILWTMIPIDELIFFRGVGIPPTSVFPEGFWHFREKVTSTRMDKKTQCVIVFSTGVSGESKSPGMCVKAKKTRSIALRSGYVSP